MRSQARHCGPRRVLRDGALERGEMHFLPIDGRATPVECGNGTLEIKAPEFAPVTCHVAGMPGKCLVDRTIGRWSPGRVV